MLIDPCYTQFLDLSFECNCVKLNAPNQDGAYSGPAWCIFAPGQDLARRNVP